MILGPVHFLMSDFEPWTESRACSSSQVSPFEDLLEVLTGSQIVALKKKQPLNKWTESVYCYPPAAVTDTDQINQHRRCSIAPQSDCMKGK